LSARGKEAHDLIYQMDEPIRQDGKLILRATPRFSGAFGLDRQDISVLIWAAQTVPDAVAAWRISEEPAAEDGECYVTLDQMAAIVNRSKRTLERLKNRKRNPLPAPDLDGGGGRPDEWLWSRIRPWLAKESGKQLPQHFPAARR
jgi:hypothetical protein